jgi:YfiH family protein
MDFIEPEWPAPARVRAVVTTREFGDLASGDARRRLRKLLPAEPAWLRQVHGTRVIEAQAALGNPQADAAVARAPNHVCVVMLADCMPVLLADEAGTTVGVAHAGWRGLCAGVIETTLSSMKAKPEETLAWLGPAIGPKVYEVGDEVRAAFVERDAAAAQAFVPTRAGHWLLDLYAVARQRLAKSGVQRVYGGDFCTFSDEKRFFSYRRDRTASRMAALIWLT